MKKGITAPKGYLASGISCGIKKNNKKDLAIIYSIVPAVVCGVTTQNKCVAAPVIYSRKILKKGIAQAIVINSGNANAFTGKKGLIDSENMANIASNELKIEKNKVLVASTGVIGKRLPMDKIKRGICIASKKISQKGIDTAKAIMTTDRWIKIAEEKIKINNKIVTIGAISKGCGMIAPNMATMLAFLTTDASIDHGLLSKILKEIVNNTFNNIVVDGDTSTNDMVIIMANGKSGTAKINNNSKEYFLFKKAVEKICLYLAKEIVKDGEGTKKIIKLIINGAKTYKDAKKIKDTVLSSVLVKTSFYGNGLNLGRIMAAIGRSGVNINFEKISLKIGKWKMIENGIINKTNKNINNYLRKKEIELNLNLISGKKSITAYGCDMGFEYVKVNVSYN